MRWNDRAACRHPRDSITHVTDANDEVCAIFCRACGTGLHWQPKSCAHCGAVWYRRIDGKDRDVKYRGAHSLYCGERCSSAAHAKWRAAHKAKLKAERAAKRSAGPVVLGVKENKDADQRAELPAAADRPGGAAPQEPKAG